ncbi:hypothetical protein [Pseudomonas sp. BE134]|uniref:hypothetical protein n=1 Tax=Pseudomonas sp. BE134 TaxID=2817843 RepID=UPI002865AB37|nr:hypothetical protein [Pseudomonas sp. BE134]MDR6924126.1 hypothetical protein [Pseudomonas sp. BE134]
MSRLTNAGSRVVRPAGSRRRTPGVLQKKAPEVPGILNDGTLPVALIPVGSPLPVIIPKWGNEHVDDYVEFRIIKDAPPTDPFLDGTIVEEGEAGPIVERPVKVEVTPGWLIEDPGVPGPATYYIWAVIWLANINPIETLPTKIIVDPTAPYQSKTTGVKAQATVAAWPLDLLNNPINDTFIANNPLGLVMTIPKNYDNPLPPPNGDTYKLWMSITYSATPTFLPINSGELPADGKVTVPIAEVAKLLGQSVYVWYQLTDFAGNVSNTSVPAGKAVQLLPPPVLKAITVPKADPVINIQDCVDGVTVDFARGDNVQATDHYVLQYGDVIIYDEEAGAAATFSIPVDKDVIASKYNDSIGGDQPITITCSLSRGPIPVGNKEALVVLKNLEYAGPTNPEHPSIVNPAMNPVEVYGLLNLKNELTPEDFEKEARMTIKLWDEPGRQPKNGQEVRAYFDGKFVPPVIFLNDGDEGKELSHALPWDIVKGSMPGRVMVYWTVATIGGANIPESPRTDVAFNAIKIELKEPTVEFSRGGKIGCPTLVAPNYEISIMVPPNTTYLPEGAEVTVFFKGYSDFPGVTPNPDANPYSVTHTVLDTEVVTGFKVRVAPFNPVIKYSTAEPDESMPGTYPGAAEVWYDVNIGGSPTPTSSLKSKYQVILIRTDFTYCDGTKYDDGKP